MWDLKPCDLKKLLSENRTFQEALQVAITDEIAAKETLQVQQRQLPQPVNSVTKEFSALPFSSRGNSANQSTSRPSPSQISSSFQPAASYACFSCGNSDHVRSKCEFRKSVCRH